MHRSTIELPNATISYVDTAHGDTTLLFVHGAFINKDYWRVQVDHFQAAYRIVTVDLPGHGLSTNALAGRTPADYARDLRQLIDTLSLKRVVLVAHSFGSDIALELIAANADEILGLVEVDHLKTVGQEPPAEVIHGVVEGLRLDFAGTAAAFARRALLTEATDPMLVARLLTDYAETDRAVGTQIFAAIPGYAQRELGLLGQLPFALHSIHVDYASTDERALRNATGGRYDLRIMSGTCHYPMVEHPEAFNRVLAEVLGNMEL